MKIITLALLLGIALTACYKPVRIMQGKSWQSVPDVDALRDTTKPTTVSFNVSRSLYGPRFSIGTTNDCSLFGHVIKHKKKVEFRWLQSHAGFVNQLCNNKYKPAIYCMFGNKTMFDAKLNGDTLILSSEKITYRFTEMPLIISY